MSELEHDLIVEHKDELDELNKEQRGLILAEKCPRCERVHPTVRYLWKHKTATDDYPALKIQIVAPDEEFLQKIFEAERALSAIGIHFDTGYGGARDWEFDWSLEGEHYLFNEETKTWELIDRSVGTDE